MKIGYKIRKLRELKNYTQTYMAMTLNITQSTYCRYENEELAFSENMLDKVAIALEMSKTAILAFDESKIFEYIESIAHHSPPTHLSTAQQHEAWLQQFQEDNHKIIHLLTDIQKNWRDIPR